MSTKSVHESTPILIAGTPLDKAKAAIVMLHGRGAPPDDMIGLASEFGPGPASMVSYVAPTAAGREWYPYRFMDVTDSNEPYLVSALNKVSQALGQVAAAGIPQSRTVILGFSQGACLALEYAARNGFQCGAVIALSGGLIGKTLDPARYHGPLNDLPVFIGCSDIDVHIPLTRVQESSALFRTLGAVVTERIYPRMGHTVNADEINFAQKILSELVSAV